MFHLKNKDKRDVKIYAKANTVTCGSSHSSWGAQVTLARKDQKGMPTTVCHLSVWRACHLALSMTLTFSTMNMCCPMYTRNLRSFYIKSWREASELISETKALEGPRCPWKCPEQLLLKPHFQWTTAAQSVFIAVIHPTRWSEWCAMQVRKACIPTTLACLSALTYS